MTRPDRRWWRENRLWLAALPFCVLAAAVGSSYNVKDLWYHQGLHHEVASGEQGRWLPVSQESTGRKGDSSRTYRIRLGGIDKTATWPYYDVGPREPPDGIDAVVAHLDWKADPDQPLFGCRMALEDDQGRRYELDTGDSLDLCTPEDHPGPVASAGDGDPGEVEAGTERPPTWSTAPVFLVPAGRHVTRLMVFWDPPPDYVTLSVS